MVTGYTIIKALALDVAVQLAKSCPALNIRVAHGPLPMNKKRHGEQTDLDLHDNEEDMKKPPGKNARRFLSLTFAMHQVILGANRMSHAPTQDT